MRKIEFTTIEELEAQLINFKVLFAYHSNKIENDKTNYHDTREIFENGCVVNYTGDLRTLYEIANQKDCFHFLLDKIIKKEPLSIELIKCIHYHLAKGTYDKLRYNVNKERPGEFKKHDYVTGVYEAGSTPENVKGDLEDLLEEINNSTSDDYLTIGAYLHVVFENIHPFADANGRVGRTLMNYYFLIHNIRPIIIYEEDRQLYYDCLEKFDKDNDLKPFIEFIKYQQEKTWQKQKAIRKTHIHDYTKNDR